MKIRKPIGVLFVFALVLAACSSAAPATPITVATISVTAAAAVGNRPAWQTMPFTDVRTNKMITLAGFAGKTVVVEAMAAWCTNCLAQQKRVAQALPQLTNKDQVVYISLGIDPSESPAQILDIATHNNFDWTFSFSNKDLTNALIEQFGRTITNPTSTPSFFISPNGTFSTLHTGIHEPAELLSLIQETAKAS
ncbi:MAG: hypothetical protein ABI947_21885 [Chloroflexota bacterium]